MANEPSIVLSFSPVGPVFAISDQAKMPRIVATATVRDIGVARPPLQFHWRVTLRSNRRGCPYASPRPVAHPDIEQTTSDGQFVIPFTRVRGGDLSVSVSVAVGGRTLTAVRDDLKIVGTNPTLASLSAAAAAAKPAFRKLMRHESTLRQFRSPGCPLWSQDGLGGVGLCQLTPPTSDDQIWDWKENVRAGLAVYAEKERVAKGYPGRVSVRGDFRQQVRDYNERRKGQGLPPVTVAVPEYTADQLERDTIRGFNGGHEYRLRPDDDGYLIVAVDATGRSGTAEWTPIKISERKSGDPNYVENVLKQADF